MFKDFISALFEKNRGFTTLEIQKSLSLFKGSKAKSPNGLAHSATKFNGKSLTGFTLIELMVVLGIILILTTVVLINYRTGNQQLALARSAHKLAQDIRRAQEMTMSSREEGSCPSGFEGSYGIRFSRLAAQYPGPKSYVLFADCDNNREYDPPPGPPAPDIVIEEVEFDQGLKVDRIKYWHIGPNEWRPNGVGEPTIDIIFSPPDPERSIFTANAAYNNAPAHKIIIKTEDDQFFRCIYINKAGLIYVDEC